MTEDTSKKFLYSIVVLIKIHPQILDSFFASRFISKAKKLVDSYIELKIQERREPKDNVAQYQSLRDFKNALNQVSEILEYLYRLNLAPATSLLSGQKVVLSIALDLARNSKIKRAKENKPDRVDKDLGIDSRNLNFKSRKIQIRPNDNKSKILDFIKNNPNTRTKDIVEEFNSISERTVKRSLVELVKGGLIARKMENKAVYYS